MRSRVRGVVGVGGGETKDEKVRGNRKRVPYEAAVFGVGS
jgi:hypothetical protein